MKLNFKTIFFSKIISYFYSVRFLQFLFFTLEWLLKFFLCVSMLDFLNIFSLINYFITSYTNGVAIKWQSYQNQNIPELQIN